MALPSTQEPATVTSAVTALDQILDLYVRDGFVYYRALKIDRGKLDTDHRLGGGQVVGIPWHRHRRRCRRSLGEGGPRRRQRRPQNNRHPPY